MEPQSKANSSIGSEYDEQSTDNLSHPTDLSDVPDCATTSKFKKLEDQANIFDNNNKPKRKLKDSDMIADSKGVFSLDKDLDEYMKARKRKQNRESANRSRLNKKECIGQLETRLKQITEDNAKLIIENASLKSENSALKSQIKFFEGVFSKQQSPKPIQPQDQSITIKEENDIEFLGLSRKNSTSSFIGVFSIVCVFSVVCIFSNSASSDSFTINGSTGLKSVKGGMPFYHYILHPYTAIALLIALSSYIALQSYIHKGWKKIRSALIHPKLS